MLVKKMDEATASLAAIETATEELEQGALVRDKQGKIRMIDASQIGAAPKGIAKRLVRLAGGKAEAFCTAKTDTI